MSGRYHHGDLKNQLVAAAIALLDDGGADAVTVRAVARMAGVAHSAPKNHFSDRAALLTAVANRIFGDLIGAIERAFAEHVSPDLKLRGFGSAITTFALTHPNRFRLLWRRESFDPSDRYIDEGISAMCERLKEFLLADGLASGRDVDTKVIALWSMVHGYVALRLDGNLAGAIDAVTGDAREVAIFDVFLSGLRGKPAAAVRG